MFWYLIGLAIFVFVLFLVIELVKIAKMAPDERRKHLDEVNKKNNERKQNEKHGQVLSSTKRPRTKRQRIKENKKNAVVGCPKCGSTDISANQEGYNIARALLINNAAGLSGKRKVVITCLNCGRRWKP